MNRYTRGLLLAGLCAAACKGKTDKASPAVGSAVGSGSGSGIGSGIGIGIGSGSGSGSGSGNGIGNGSGSGSAASGGSGSAVVVGCEGWKASKIEWMGMGQTSLTVECAKNAATISSSAAYARDDEAPEPLTKQLSREAWNELWRRLEAGGWRTLAAKCPPAATPPESTDITDLELAISDGTTSKEIKCEAVNLGAAHQALREAFDDAAKAAGLPID